MKRLNVGIGVLMAVMLSLPLSSAQAGDDRIVFACSTYSDPFLNGSDLCVVDPDSSAAATNITNSPAGQENFPVYSPDATKIAFSESLPSQYRDIYVTSATPSGSAANISDSPACHEWEPGASWSPNGLSLTYQTTLCSPDPQDRVYVAPSSGSSDPVRFGPAAQIQHYPDWSPDGTKIAYQGAGVGPAGIYIGPADGSSTPTFLNNTSAGFTPEWSPDGTRILTVISPSSNYTVRVVKADGTGTPIDLVTYGTILYGEGYAWSPDGTKVAWIKNNGVIHINSASDPGTGHDLPAGPIVSHNLSYSPDGTRVVFDASPVPAHNPNLRVLYTQKVDGSQAPVPITDFGINAQEPDWMPRDGVIGPPDPTKPRKTIIFVNIKRYPTATGNGHVLSVGINCKAEGGTGSNPYCQLHGEAEYGSARSSGGHREASASAAKKKVIFAKGKVKIPGGKKKPLKMKITKAGLKLMKKGKNLKLKLTVKNTRKGYKPQTVTRNVILKPKKG